MNRSRKARAAGLATALLAAAALAACGSQAPQPASPSSPSQTVPATPAAPAPSASTPAPSASTPAPETVLSSRVTYAWHWPNDAAHPGLVRHSYHVPPLPQLVAIRVGHHPAAGGERAYNRMSFTFTTAFPTYEFGFVHRLVSDGSGKPIALTGNGGVLRVIFREAQAHTGSGASSVLTQPPAQLGLSRMVSWAPAGDFEGVLTYGIGIQQPVAHSSPRFPVRAYELEKITSAGQHQYIVAIDIDAS